MIQFAGLLHGNLPTKNYFFHVVVVPSGGQAFLIPHLSVFSCFRRLSAVRLSVLKFSSPWPLRTRGNANRSNLFDAFINRNVPEKCLKSHQRFRVFARRNPSPTEAIDVISGEPEETHKMLFSPLCVIKTITETSNCACPRASVPCAHPKASECRDLIKTNVFKISPSYPSHKVQNYQRSRIPHVQTQGVNKLNCYQSSSRRSVFFKC